MFCGAVGVEEGVVKQVTPFKWGSGSLVFEIESEVDLKGLKVDFKKLVSERLGCTGKWVSC